MEGVDAIDYVEKALREVTLVRQLMRRQYFTHKHHLSSRYSLLFRVYLEKELIMEEVRLIKCNPEGVALKDDRGVSRIIDGTYISEVEGVAGYVTLRHAGQAGQAS